MHYLPHHGVIRKTALTTKLRVVFDASSKANSKVPSLNDCIYVGPPLTPAILDILLRFRAKKIGLVADIQQAILNISVDERHRDYLRFLWVNNIYDKDPDVIILCLARVAFGVNVSPFLLNATLKLLDSFYVDDFNSGENKVDDAFQLYQKTKKCLSDGGFHLRKWASNNSELMAKIKQEGEDRNVRRRK